MPRYHQGDARPAAGRVSWSPGDSRGFWRGVSHSPSGPLHGKTTLINHNGNSIFRGLPSPLVGGRYHSLAITKLPQELEVTARTEEGIIMGIKHKHRPIYGLQFHPESVLTPDGLEIVENFLKVAQVS